MDENYAPGNAGSSALASPPNAPAGKEDDVVRRSVLPNVTSCLLAIVMLGPLHGAAGSNGVGRVDYATPPARFGMGMVSDSVRNEIVLFGGSGPHSADNPDGTRHDTWVWDGTGWTERLSESFPPPRDGLGMAFDAAHGVSVLFGGQRYAQTWYRDTWIWDGADWTQVSDGPRERSQHGMVYDVARGNVVMFGGSDATRCLRGTWIWDGQTWSRRRVDSPPEKRLGMGMAYDAALAEVVMFGGFDTNGRGYLADTWIWDGTTWAQQRPARHPGARSGAVMAYDAARDQIVLFGGSSDPFTLLGDTWIWDGSTWTRVTPPVSPPPRQLAGMAYDAARQEIVLFGGMRDGGITFNDTWTWDGTTWTQVG